MNDPIIDKDIEGVSGVRVNVRHGEHAIVLDGTAALVVMTQDVGGDMLAVGPVTFQGPEGHLSGCVAGAIAAAANRKMLTQVFRTALQHEPRSTLRCFADAILFTLTGGGTDGRAAEDSTPDARGEAGPGPGRPGAGGDPKDPPQEGGV